MSKPNSADSVRRTSRGGHPQRKAPAVDRIGARAKAEIGLKFLFLISHGLYLRNFGGLVEALKAAGHEVVIGKTSEKVVDDTALDRLPRAGALGIDRNRKLGLRLRLRRPGIRALPKRDRVAPARLALAIAGRSRPLSSQGGRIWRADPPVRNGAWWPAADPLRAVRDYLRYLEPEYAQAPKLAQRAAGPIPGLARRLFEGTGLSRLAAVRRAMGTTVAFLERSLPPDPALRDYIARHRPDAVLITPMVDFDYYQLDALKAALAQGVPTALLVASWDNLTSKGLIQIAPDLVTVWNDLQRGEARDMHAIPAERIVMTGAQLYDHWFTMQPSRDRAQFCREAGGLDPQRPIILYLCSSPFVCPDEVTVVRRWLAAVRQSSDELVRTANVLVRPHPSHGEQWRDIRLEEGSPVAIWPRLGAAPIEEEGKRGYFDSLFHAATIVGVNTSGFLEAAILGRRTLVLQTPELTATQDGTLHFRYLVEGGLLSCTSDVDRHLSELGSAMRAGAREDAELKAFVQNFLRPKGLEQPCLPQLVEALTRLAASGHREPLAEPRSAWLVRAALVPFKAMVATRYKKRLEQRARLAAARGTGVRKLDSPTTGTL